MKKILVFFLIMFGLFSKVSANYIKLAYDFEFSGIEGKTIKLSDYKNKVIVVVNVASRCGFTNQYDGFQKLWTDYKDKDLVVLGVPTNDFKQEPGSNSEIKDFCETNFNVSFPMTKKVNVIGNKENNDSQKGRRKKKTVRKYEVRDKQKKHNKKEEGNR